MEHPVLSDKNTYPTDTVLSDHLNRSMSAWNTFSELMRNDFPSLRMEWKYYSDGHQWLCKVTEKTKTVCWISVWDKYFKAGFYFSAKAKELLTHSTLDTTIKKAWLKYGDEVKFRAISVPVKKKSDVATIKTLIELKRQMK